MTETTMNVNPRDKAFVITPLTGSSTALSKIKEKIASKKEYIDLPFIMTEETSVVCDGLYEFLMNLANFEDDE